MPSASTTPRRARPMNIVIRRGSPAEHKYRSIAGVPDLLPEQLAPGVPPTPAHDLLYHGGKTIPNLTFKNFYVAGDAWQARDIQNIDRALAASSRAVCLLEGRVALAGRSAALERAALISAYFGSPAGPGADPAVRS